MVSVVSDDIAQISSADATQPLQRKYFLILTKTYYDVCCLFTERDQPDDYADHYTDLLKNRSMPPFKKYATLLVPNKIDLAPVLPARKGLLRRFC